MNTKVIFAASAAITFAAGTAGTYLLGKKRGKTALINKMRDEQLAEAAEELNTLIAGCDDTESVAKATAWFEKEVNAIMEIYGDLK